MSCRILRDRHLVHHVEYSLDYPGYGFPVINGAVVPCVREGISHRRVPIEECPWWDNYLMCKEKYGEGEVVKYQWDYFDPAIAECACGKQIALENEYLGACQCPKCGQWYNLFGQELVDPEYWNDEEECYYE